MRIVVCLWCPMWCCLHLSRSVLHSPSQGSSSFVMKVTGGLHVDFSLNCAQGCCQPSDWLASNLNRPSVPGDTWGLSWE